MPEDCCKGGRCVLTSNYYVILSRHVGSTMIPLVERNLSQLIKSKSLILYGEKHQLRFANVNSSHDELHCVVMFKGWVHLKEGM